MKRNKTISLEDDVIEQLDRAKAAGDIKNHSMLIEELLRAYFNRGQMTLYQVARRVDTKPKK